jgi:glycosyltransferase involved in cell wall biosynthesis
MAGRRLLILSYVLPFPRNAGQQQRVYYTLTAARSLFHVTFATFVAPHRVEETRRRLASVCDEAIVLPSLYQRSRAAQFWHRAAGVAYALRTGLKRSNYAYGSLEFHPSRVAEMVDSRAFDAVLYEYWHAVDSTDYFRSRGIPCVLDMHDILWQSYDRQLREHGWPAWARPWAVERYKTHEERAWPRFDALIAINREEERYARERVPRAVPVFHAGMGTDIGLWPFSPEPRRPPRFAYYGGLGGRQNQLGALTCLTRIMPIIWRTIPDAEYWMVGSNPPETLRSHTSDPRIKVTGFVENVQDILRTMSAVICPWTGTYGFRSRLIEVMALGVPIVVSPDAIAGMELEPGEGLLIGRDDTELATHSLRLAADPEYLDRQGRLARQQVERGFSIDATYGRLMIELDDWLAARSRLPRTATDCVTAAS